MLLREPPHLAWMSEAAGSSQFYPEFVKFGKFFTTRLVQAVVQSRLGQLMVQSCCVRPDTSDWFNLRIDEFGEIAAHMRSNVSRYPPISGSLTLDFLLHTADGDVLPLESWCVSFDPSDIDQSVNVRTQLYHQLGTMLKSAIVAARVTPMHRYYVRKQSAETFIILYRVYEGEPTMDLGEDSRKIRIGSLPSPFGAICVDLLYRTRMEINRTAKRVADSACSVATQILDPTEQDDDVERGRSIPFRTIPASGGTVEAVSPVSDVISNFSTSPASQSEFPFASPQKRTHFRLGRSASSSDDSSLQQQNSDNQSFDEQLFKMESVGSSRFSSSLPQRPFMQTQQPRTRNYSFPFAALLTATSATNVHCNEQMPQLTEDNNDNTTPTAAEHPGTSCATVTNTEGSDSRQLHQSATAPAEVNLMQGNSSADERRKRNDEELSDEDDLLSSDDSFVKVAFGSGENLDGDLGEFVKQFRLAPAQTLCFRPENTSGIPNLLAEFEMNQKMFDSFVSNVKSSVNDDEEG